MPSGSELPSFLVLGPLEVQRAGKPVDVAGAKLRRLVAMLALQPHGVALPDSDLFEALWPEGPPRRAEESLRVHISRLRRLIGPEAVVRRPGGYALDVAPPSIDALRFEALVETARAARSNGGSRALEAYREAERLWRGEVAGDVDFERAPPRAVELNELHLVATEERVDVALTRGHGPELIPELESLVARHPTRERLRGQLMLALYAGGQQTQALRVYRDTRAQMVDELGVEPGPELRDLEKRILTQDPDLPRAQPPTVRATRRGRLALVVGAAAALVAVVAGVLLATTDGTSAPPRVLPNSLVEIDARTNEVVSVTPLPDQPDAMAVTREALWVTNVGARTIARVGLDDRRVEVRGGCPP